EDGIRDRTVTGVQTCALPISWTAWSGISTIAGPAAGGFLTETLSWRFVFWINVPLIVATLALTAHSVAESRDPDAVAGFDVPGEIGRASCRERGELAVVGG